MFSPFCIPSSFAVSSYYLLALGTLGPVSSLQGCPPPSCEGGALVCLSCGLPDPVNLAVHRLRAWQATRSFVEPWVADLSWVATLQSPVETGFIQYWSGLPGQASMVWAAVSVLPWGVANRGGGEGGHGQATASLGISQLETTEVPGNSCLSVHTGTHTDTMLI